jgi:type I site-specific restriction endonuclease
MFKTSVATRLISCAVLITLLLGSFPTAASAAETNNHGLETKWAKLIDTYNRQSLIHDGVPRWVAHWLDDHRRAPASKKAELQKDLAKSNNAWAPVSSIVTRHNGFDTNGNVVDRAAARQSVKDLSKALKRYIASVRNLRALIKQFNLEG